MDPDQHFNALNRNDMLHWYEILEILGQGGFGITYLARDTNLDQLVAIKEYLPTEFSTRDSHSTVQPISEGHTKVFDWGKMRFLDEARTLAQFRHPNVVRVHSFFENNNTGYMVMEYEEGTDLEKVIKAGESFDERRILDFLLPVLDGLELVHQQGFIHRDIKPANIFIRHDGSPVLIDFGSARQAVGGQTRTMTSLVTPGFAPFEQYHDAEGKQGPWTDIYSLGATCYSAITGKPPIDALKRGMARLDHSTDAYLHLVDLRAGKFSDHFLQSIDYALQFKETDRPQDVTVWRSMLLNEIEVPQSQIQTQLGPGAADDANEAPVEATRVEPGLTEQTRTDPAPAEPARAEPAPTEPSPKEPIEIDSVPVESTRVQSIQVEPTRVNPIPVEPTRIEPAPVESDRAKTARDDSTHIDPGNVDVSLEKSQDKPANRKILPIAIGVVGIMIVAVVLLMLPASKEDDPASQSSRSEAATASVPLAGSSDSDEDQAMLEKQQQEQARIAEEQERLKQEQARINEEKEKLDQEQARLAQEEQDRQAALASEQEAEQKRQAELARQQEEEQKRQAELARQQEEERERQAELARQQEEERERQAELARQQEEERERQAELERQKQLEQQAALSSQAQTGQSTAAPLDLSGTYVPDEGFEELVLKHKGDRITGFIGTNQSTFEGQLEGNKLVFTFMYSKTGYGHRKGHGEFAVSPDGNRLTGTRKGGAFPKESPWNLTRTEQAEKKVAKSNSSLTGTFVPDEGFEDLVLKQSGNKVTGFIGTNQSTIEGRVEGNKFVFTFMYSKTGYGHRKGSGELVISPDGNRLTGTRKGGSFPTNSTWNLTRKQDP